MRSSWQWWPKLARRLSAAGGQATVLLAIASTVLVGFTGLALDGGLAAAQQRVVQNAADAAALAGAQEIAADSAALQSTVYNRVQEYAVTKNAARCVGGTCNQSATARYVLSDGTTGSTVGTTGSIPGGCKGVCVTETLTYSPLFMRILGVNTITVAATSCAQYSSGGECFGGYALWANGSLSGCNEINVSSNSVKVNGNVWTNSDIFSSAATSTPLKIDGDLTYVSSCSGCSSGKVTVTGTTTSPTSSPASAYSNWGLNNGVAPYSLASYQPTGTYALAAKADTDPNHTSSYTDPKLPAGTVNSGHYHYIDGSWNVSANTVLDGLYYVNGDFGQSQPSVCSATNQCNPFTVVATGSITWSGGNETLTPYSHGLLLYSDQSDNCSSQVINLSGNSTSFSGVIYAPNGLVRLSGNNATSYNGTVVAKYITITAGATINYDSSYCNPGGTSTGVHLTKP